MVIRIPWLVVVLGATTFAPPSAPTPGSVVTLGTNGGPIANPERSQPATLLRGPDGPILIDAGDGAAEQLAKVGVAVRDLRHIVLTHLHADHTGGLFAILAMRFQLSQTAPLAIYGPPGTRRTVDGLLAALEPLAKTGAGLPGRPVRNPAAEITVVEIVDGDSFRVGAIPVRAVANTHYSYRPGSSQAREFQSLSYRFELPGRSVVFTGDTGPSAAVVALAHGADLLVSEVIDPEAAIAALRRSNPALPQATVAAIAPHFSEQHLTPAAVGDLARDAGVKQLVLTHVAVADALLADAERRIASHYRGRIDIAQDLDSF